MPIPFLDRLCRAAVVVWLVASTPSVLAQQPAPPPPEDAPASSEPAQAPAVIETFVTRYRMERDGRGVADQHLRVKVLSDQGVQAWGQLSAVYTPLTQAMSVEAVEVHKPDGAVVRVPASAVNDAAVQPDAGGNVLQDLRQALITVPALAVGDTVVMHTRRTYHTPAVEHHFWIEHEFLTDGVVRDERLEIDIPAALTPVLRLVAAAPAEASGGKGEVAGDRRVYRWATRNLVPKEPPPPATDHDPGDTVLPDVRLSTFADWPSVASWYGELASRAVVVDDSIRAKAAALTAGLTTEDARIQALYDFVAKEIRYVSLSFGLGRFAPHPAPEVLANRYGDCKDKHTLLAALLRAAGLEAWPVLANFGRRIDPGMPSPAEFNHLITAIPRGAGPAEWIWLDTTPGVAPYRMLLAPLRDRDVLVVAPPATGRGSRPALVRTPRDTPFARFARVELDGSLDALGVLRGTVRTQLRGDSEVPLRLALAQAPSDKFTEFLRRSGLLSVYGDGISNGKPLNLDTTRQPVGLHADVRRPGLLRWTATGATLSLPAVRVDLRFEDAEDWKDQPQMQLGSPFASTFAARLRLPAGYRPSLPVPVKLVRDEVEYVSDYRLEDGAIVVERTFRMKQPAVLAAAAPAYISFVAAVRADEKQTIELTFDGDATPVIPADATAAEIYKVAYAMYEHRRDAQAVTLLTAAVARDPKHDAAWDALGLAHQRLGRLPDAIDALRKQIEVKPYHDRAHSHLAGALRAAKRYDEARAAMRKHLEIVPLDGQAHGDLGRWLVDSGETAEAITHLERAIALKKGNAWTHAYLGAAHAARGDAVKARAAFEDAIRQSPEPPIPTFVAWRLVDHGLELAWAEQLAKDVLAKIAGRINGLTVAAVGAAEHDLVDRAVWAWDALAQVQVRANRLDAATPYLEAALVLSDDPGVARHHAGLRSARPAVPAPPAWLTDGFAVAGTGVDGTARLTLLVGGDGRIRDVRVDAGDEALTGIAAGLKGTSLALRLPDPTLTQVPIDVTLRCATPAGCRAVVDRTP